VSTPTQEEVRCYLDLKVRIEEAQAELDNIEKRWAERLSMEFGKRVLIAGSEDPGALRIYAERPLVEEWDQSELDKAAVELLSQGIDHSSFLRTTYEVDKRALKRQPAEVQKLVDRARIMSGLKKNGEPRKPKFTVE
jgi:hypothetical protein